MISELAKLDPKRLGVIARRSAIQYKAAKKTIGEIAQELNVDYVLEAASAAMANVSASPPN